MIDLVCQDAALETCHSWIYLNADYQLVNALSPLISRGKRIQLPTPQKHSELKQYLKFLKESRCPLSWKFFLNRLNHIFHDCI